MKNKIALGLGCALLSVSMISSFTGCNRKTSGVEIDEGKTQLYVGAYDGAYQQGFADATVRRFEEIYKNVSFEEGKTGVQVITEVSQNYEGRKLLGNVKNYKPEIYFVELFDYFDFIDAKEMLDITDLVTSPLNYNFVTEQTNAGGESCTFESKIAEEYVDYLNIGTETAKQYYAVPVYESYYTMQYDINLFKEKNLYFADYANTFVTKANPQKSNGPDGQPNTYDDGLPATYEQFYALCDRMVQLGITPMVYAGQYPGYVNQALNQAWADFEGEEQIMLNYNFNGVAKNLVNVSADGTVTKLGDTVITGENGYLTHAKQEGKYNALKFLYNLLTRKKNGKGYFDTSLSTYSHIEAQKAFLRGKYEVNAKPYGMLFDGTWWKYEAQDTVQQLATEKQLTNDEMQWGIMPMPKASLDHLGKQTRLTLGCYAFIASNIASSKTAVAKAFLQFLVQQESLLEFTNEFECFLAYDYKLDKTSDIYKNLSSYAKVLYDIHEQDTLLPCYHDNATFKKVASSISIYDGVWTAVIDGTPISSPVSKLGTGVGKYTAEQYFNGLSIAFNESGWRNLIG